MGILHIVGARPNFVKATPVIEALKKRGILQSLIHTGQHSDEELSGAFFRELALPPPDLLLNVKNSLPLSRFIAQIHRGLSVFCQIHQPRLALVYGDVNSTLAAALAFQRLNIPVAHVEAGLRSFDNTMPEETNRILVDHLSSWLFTTEPSANENLLKEGFELERIFFVGNCMIDTLKRCLSESLEKRPHEQFGLEARQYLLCTFHRPGNVDNLAQMTFIMELLDAVSNVVPVIFPVHPRTEELMRRHKMVFPEKVILSRPLSYLNFTGLMANAMVVLTDSGGVQEETTWLNVPCLTLRPNTERPITIEQGTNQLVDSSIGLILSELGKISNGETKKKKEIERWDGRAGERVAEVLAKYL